MPELTEDLLLSFRAALHKEAGYADAIARAAPRLRAAGSLGGVGAAVGALGGAGLGATRKFQEARQEGQGIGSAALQAGGGMLSGALRGAGVGALAGAGAGGLTGAGAGLASRAGRLGGAARFGQRQVHSLTGMLQPHELEAIGGGAAPARGALKAVREQAAAHAMQPGHAFSDYAGKIDRAKRGLEASEKAQGMGLTSMPGYLSSVKKDGLTSTLGAGMKDQYYNTPKALTALMVGLPAASAAGTLLKKENPTGPGKGEELGRNLGGVVGGVAGSAMPIVGNTLVGGALSSAGARVGKTIDWMRGRRNASPMTGSAPREPVEGQHMPSERVMSPAAAGQQPEGV